MGLQVPDVLVVKAAAQKALFAHLRGTLRSRSMHAELVFSVAGSKHVSTPLLLLSGHHLAHVKPYMAGNLQSQWIRAPEFFHACLAQVGEALKRFGIAGSGKGSDSASNAVTDIIVASIHKGAPDVSLLHIIRSQACPAAIEILFCPVIHSVR